MIGYLSLGRDTFDIKYAKQKIYNISKILKKLDYKISENQSKKHDYHDLNIMKHD